jgi:hypothetical protein
MSTPAWKKAQRQAEHQQLKLQKEREKLYGSARTIQRKKKEFQEYVPPKSYHRETTKHPSLSTVTSNTCTKRDKTQYTGDYLIGIATMHKSNLVPVTRGVDPKDYATMRRN